MNFYGKKFTKSILAIMLLSLISCVGTVKNKNAAQSNVVSDGGKDLTLTFTGLSKAIPIAHNKVELSFFPATGDPANIVYQIYINGSPISSSISGSSLTLSSTGLLKTTVTNLTIDTTYTFNMKAISTGTGATTILDPAKAISATTFANETADFLGISSAQIVPGIRGERTVIVNWNSAVAKSSNAGSPRATDVVSYEIKWISSVGRINNLNNDAYTDADKHTAYVKGSPDGSIPSQTSFVADNLNPGTTYYFQVRAIHKNFAAYSATDPNYKHEMNTKYITVTTLNSSGIFSFPDKISVTSPVGKNSSNASFPYNALTKLNVSWTSATGAFYNYRVCYLKFTPTEPFDPAFDIYDDYLKDDVNINVNDTNVCQLVDSDKTYATLSGLDPYARYQVKVVACKSSLCELGNRKFSDLGLGQVKPAVSPFGGITSFRNPTDESPALINNIKLFFDPPDTKAGFVNKYKIYCYDGANDPNPVALRADNSHLGDVQAGKSICSKILVPTTLPTSAIVDDFDSFSELELTLPDPSPVDSKVPIDGTKQYCFSVVPTIDSTPYVGNATKSQENRANFPPKCFTPKIETPTIIQFPGRNEVCSIVNKNIQITWSKPTGALYQSFIVFWQEKKTDGVLFDFKAATAAYGADPAHVDATCLGTTTGKDGYCWKEVLKTGMDNYSYELTNLIPGTKYNIGVLPYLLYGSVSPVKLWAQYNYNVGDCSLPLPTAKFNEWVQIFAVGPKEDGLVPANEGDRLRTYFTEKLNADDAPVEVDVGSNAVFDGIYGKISNIDTNPPLQYSNSGIVQLRWKDVLLYDESEKLSDRIAAYDAANIASNKKNSRAYGYRVYRSDDNKLTWNDLTKYDLVKNPNQLAANQGLIHPQTFASRKLGNQVTADSDKVATFTDYSVLSSVNAGEIDRAKVLFYKIVPVFNGKELTYDSTPLNGEIANPTHHIVKVILPPRNMALVNRLISNRSACNELGKDIHKGATQYYSCDYNGLGATSLTKPLNVNDGTVLDQGGDLLVDRFELSVPFTRGHPAVANSSSTAQVTATKVDFTGRASNSTKFRGCFNNDLTHNESNIVGLTQPGAQYSYHNLMPGDCMSNDLAYNLVPSGACNIALNPSSYPYTYPGSAGNGSLLCSLNSKNAGDYIMNLANTDSPMYVENGVIEPAAQGEFASVFYNRANDISYDNIAFYNLPAGNGAVVTDSDRKYISSGFLNLPYFNSAGKMFPRWFSLNRIFGNIKINGTSLSLWSMTIKDVINSALFDSSNVIAPALNSDLLTSSRFDINTTPIARIVTSNASKLPPIQGFGWKDSNQVCSTYKIQVGYETAAKGFKTLAGGASGFGKRILRRKEFVAAAAWPTTWDTTKIQSIEGKDSDVAFTPDAKGCQSSGKITKLGINGTGTIKKNTALYTNSSNSDNYFTKSFGSPLVVSGSSGANSTESCVSRYGVQDMAGNLREFNSDSIFCSVMNSAKPPPVIYIQPGGSFPSGIDVLNIPAANDIPYSNSYFYDPTSVHAYVSGTPISGECSTTSAGPSWVDPNTELSPVVKPGAAISYSNIISQMTIPAATLGSIVDDPISMTTTRDGRGHYLEFSNNGFIGQLKTNDTFSSLSTSGYFNPVLGMPLLCNGACADATDNQLAKTTLQTTPAPSVIVPIHNANFGNNGVEQISPNFGPDTNQSFGYSYNFVNGIHTSPILDFDLQFVGAGQTLSSPGALYGFYFNVSRSDAMRFSSGGSIYSGQAASRYTLFVDGLSQTTDRMVRDVGIRCGILIEE